MIAEPMRVLLDVNLLISYLLPSSKQQTIAAIVEAAFEGSFTLLLPPELVQEFSTTIGAKRYLARRIRPEDATSLVTLLSQVAEIIPPISGKIPAVCRDAKDDYLLAYALVGQADYLVTGDNDLLVLGEVERMRIVSPADFLKVLRGRG
ncbi:MAG: putative toxin-antitoxin system toxin component, PIN family [Chloroflexota bacterium]|nr:MAG: putative toxin-antitoxin system toxin component, PIN family [Chloroflexota bacterium]